MRAVGGRWIKFSSHNNNIVPRRVHTRFITISHTHTRARRTRIESRESRPPITDVPFKHISMQLNRLRRCRLCYCAYIFYVFFEIASRTHTHTHARCHRFTHSLRPPIYGSTLFYCFSLAFVCYTRFFVAVMRDAVNENTFFSFCIYFFFRSAKRAEAIINTRMRCTYIVRRTQQRTQQKRNAPR